MALTAGKIYTPASASEIRDDFLTDLRLEARKFASVDEVDRVTRPGTDWHIIATAVGNLGLLQYHNINAADSDSDVLTATGAALDAKREALGLPEAPKAGSAGLVTFTSQAGATVHFNNHEFVLPNGKRGRVDGAHSFVMSGKISDDVPVITIDTGADTNAASGVKVRWVSPPLTVKTEAEVSASQPLTGGRDDEDDERKRDRILNKLQNIPAGGNWGDLRERAVIALGTVQAAFVYPALGGPGSVKVALVRDFDDELFSFTRALGTVAVSVVRQAIQSAMPSPMEIVIQSAVDEITDVSVKLELPDAAAAGGNGKGWTDAAPWPLLTGGETVIAISSLVSADALTVRVGAGTTTAPTAGQTRIAWWSSVDQKFHRRLVTGVAGSAGAWDITLDSPLTDHNNAVALVGEYICPDAVDIEAYGKTWIDIMRKLGPGENTADGARLPRAKRHPFVDQDWPSDLGLRALTTLTNAHDEIQDGAWSFRSLSAPTTPGSVATAPNVLTPRHFGVYKLV